MPARRYAAATPAGVAIRRGIALTRGLVWCLAPGAGSRAELVSGRLPSLNASAAFDGATAFGEAADSSSTTTGGLVYPWDPRFYGLTDRATLVWVGRIDALTSNSAILSVPARATHVTPFRALSLHRQATADQARFAWNDAGSVVGINSSSGGIVAADGWTTLIAGGKQSNVYRFWKDGRFHSTSTFGSTANFTFDTETAVGVMCRGVSNTAESLDGATTFAAIWDRLLGDDEIAQLWQDPFVVLARPRSFAVGSVGGTIHALAGTSTGTGSQSGTLIVAKPLAGSNVGTGMQTGALLEADHLAGSSLGTGTATGALVSTKPIAGGSVGTGSQGGSLTESDTVAGSTLGTGTASGTVKRAVSLSGISTGTGTASASFAGAQALAGTTTGTGTQTGSLVEADTVAGATTGAGSQTGALRLVRGVAGIATGTGSLSGTLRRTITLSGEIVGAGDTWGYLDAAKPLSGVSVGMGSAFGGLDVAGAHLPGDLSFRLAAMPVLTLRPNGDRVLSFTPAARKTLAFTPGA